MTTSSISCEMRQDIYKLDPSSQELLFLNDTVFVVNLYGEYARSICPCFPPRFTTTGSVTSPSGYLIADACIDVHDLCCLCARASPAIFYSCVGIHL